GSAAKLSRALRELESALRSGIGRRALRLALVDVLEVDVGAESQIVRAPVPAHISGVRTRRIAIAVRLEVVGRAELREAVDEDERPAELGLVGCLESWDLHHGPAEILI